MGGTNLGKDYKLSDEVIPHDTKEKDMGVVITEDFKSSQQCVAAATKTINKLRVIKRTLSIMTCKKCFTILYKDYVWPPTLNTAFK